MTILIFSLCLEIVDGYVALDEEHQQRNIMAWRPTLVEILDGFVSFSDADV
jgi:brefeldin A-inhibited guanine nucleotide-exchange protein